MKNLPMPPAYHAASSPSLRAHEQQEQLGIAEPEQLLTIGWDFVNSYREKEGRDNNAQQ